MRRKEPPLVWERPRRDGRARGRRVIGEREDSCFHSPMPGTLFVLSLQIALTGFVLLLLGMMLMLLESLPESNGKDQ